MTFGKRLRILREALDWTQDMLGKKLGVSRTAICNWELGVCEPRRPLKKLVEMWMDQKEKAPGGPAYRPVAKPFKPDEETTKTIYYPDRTALKQLRDLLCSNLT